MAFDLLPPFAAWRHVEAQDGFEVAFMHTSPNGVHFEGQTVGIEDGEPWWVHYVIDLTPDWVTRRAAIRNRSRFGERAIIVEADGRGTWRVNGEPQPNVQGCLDIDLESSAMTNAFPIHRFAMDVDDAHDAPAAYIREVDLRIERLEQHYRRLPDGDRGQRYAYLAPVFDADFELPYDASGLVIDYPGIARRVL